MVSNKMKTEEKYMDRVNDVMESGGKVLVTVGDFGEDVNAVGDINTRVVINTIFITEDKPLGHSTNFLFQKKEDNDFFLMRLKDVATSYFESEMSPNDLQKFRNLFNF